MYIQNTGDEFAPANCTFAVNYNSNILKFIDLAGIPDVIFSNRPDVGYATLRTAPTPDAVDPLPDVRTIEIDYDAYANLGGLPVPYEKTYLGTLRFELKDNKNSVVFRWHESCAVHTTKNQIVTEYGDFRQIPILLMFTAKITNPNGGEKINQGKNYQIKWTANGGDKVQIEFSSNSGDTWLRITEEEISIQQKYFDWSVPNIISNNCLVRIIDFETGGELDRSDSTFSIVQSFAQIIRPSSGDIMYIGGSTDYIRWFNSGYNTVRFEFSSDGGNPWVKVGGSVNANLLDMQWKLPEVTTKQALVRMIDVETENVVAISGLFKIISGILSFISPRQDDVLNVGSLTRVRWSASGVQQFDLFLSIDGGNSWELVTSPVEALYGYLNWTVPDKPTNFAILKALWMSDPEMEYGRTGVFKINKINNVEHKENNILNINEPYPNPFSDRAILSFFLPSSQHISITITNALGEVIKFTNSEYPAGDNIYYIYGSDLPQGIYFIKVNIDNLVVMKKTVKVN